MSVSAQTVEQGLARPLSRLDLYHSNQVAVAAGNPLAKMRFSTRAVLVAMARKRPRIILAFHVGLLPVALTLRGIHGPKNSAHGDRGRR